MSDGAFFMFTKPTYTSYLNPITHILLKTQMRERFRASDEFSAECSEHRQTRNEYTKSLTFLRPG